MSMEVQAVHQVTDELVEAAGRLLAQLSSSAAPPDVNDLTRIVEHQATTLFVAGSEEVIVGMLTLLNLFERHRSTTAAYRCSVWR
jgi:hypothetical protein